MEVDTASVGIYSFEISSSLHLKFLLLKNGNKYQIMEPFLDTTGVCNLDKYLMELMKYFDSNPEIDKRLLPLYTQALCEVYDNNTASGAELFDEWGYWHMKEKYRYLGEDKMSDSMKKEYEMYMEFKKKWMNN